MGLPLPYLLALSWRANAQYRQGYTGAALSLLVWSFGLLHPNTPFPSASPYPNASSLIGEIKSALSQAQKHNPESPRVLIIGALGRCGAGATQLLLESGISESAITKWDIQETSTSPVSCRLRYAMKTQNADGGLIGTLQRAIRCRHIYQLHICWEKRDFSFHNQRLAERCGER